MQSAVFYKLLSSLIDFKILYLIKETFLLYNVAAEIGYLVRL